MDNMKTGTAIARSVQQIFQHKKREKMHRFIRSKTERKKS